MPPKIDYKPKLGKYSPSPNREAAKKALREGMTPEECATKFDIGTRTAYRYLSQVRHPTAPSNIHRRITFEGDELAKTLQSTRAEEIIATRQVRIAQLHQDNVTPQKESPKPRAQIDGGGEK